VFEGDNYYDIVPSTNLMVAYFEPEGHQLIGDFSPPVAHLRVEKWLTGQNVTTGGNAAFYIQYRNEGNAPAENVTITDTLVGMTYLRDTSGLPINGGDTEKTWDLGTVEPGDWISFFLFAEVTADEGQFVSNTAQISTSSPDIGDPGDKIGTWEGNVAGNDTYLSVGKDTWTWNPAPDQDFVYRVSVCNNGSTASSVVTLTDTLPDVVSLVTWWGDDPGWTEVDVSGNPLILEHSCISSWSCSDIYFQVHLSDLAEPGNELINHAAISGGNDLSPDDNETEVQHNVGEPYIDLRIQQSWHGGSLVPGGYYSYGMNFSNDGNVGIAGPIAVKATLPPGTSYEGWDSMDFVRVEDPPVVDGNEITWQIVDGLLPGYYGTIEVWVAVDPLTTPGTELNHFVEIDIQPEEDNIDNNSSMFTETINDHGPNLRITKNGGVHGHGEGHNLWYNLHVENIGDQTVNDIVVTDYYPTGMELDGEISTNYSEGWSWWDNDPEDQAFSVYLEYVGPGWTFDIDFNTVIPGEDPLEPGVVYENLAEVHPMVGDVNPDDNTTSYIMATGPDMYVEKTLETGTFLPDEQVTYLLTFGNMHRNNEWWWDMTGNAIITDILPKGMSYVSAELHWCESTEWCQADPIIDGQILTWNLYPIGRSNWNEIRLTVEIGDVEQTNPLINEIMIVSDQPLVDVDPYLENNFSFYDPGIVVTFNTFLPLILR
jgi:uncharacterized repeat protein (TIGR01451 family)